jgi:hypothetical protein
VDAGNQLLVCTKEKAQLVKEIAEHMQRLNANTELPNT